MQKSGDKSLFPYVAGLVAAAVYTTVSFVTPQNPNATNYGLSAGDIRLLILSLLIPIFIIWMLAIYSSLGVSRYATLLRETKEGGNFRRFADGVLILVFSLIVGSMISAFNSAMVQLGAGAGWRILSEYVAVFLPLVAFFQIFRGSQSLVRANQHKSLRRNRQAAALIAVVMTAVYALTLFGNSYRSDTPDINKFSSYFLPDWLIILTIVLPYGITWLLGLLATTNIMEYRLRVKGVIYRQAFSSLAIGLATVVVVSIMGQFLTAVGPALAAMGLSGILGIVYFLLLIIAVGYGFLARGARQLSKIEEVA
ncbi:MAG TPA: hypothetical protein VLF21_03395 [Candidatus Saccharimonadales bacterium]|nr:hypothetical protein [Candidatus Saccharimonadales bacterium]